MADQVKKRKTLELSYHTCLTEMGEVLLPDRPANLSGLRIDLFQDEFVPSGASAVFRTTRRQVHVSGTSHALRELGRYLIAIAENKVPRDMTDHFEDIKGADDRPAVHLVVHHEYRRDLRPTVEVR